MMPLFLTTSLLFMAPAAAKEAPADDAVAVEEAKEKVVYAPIVTAREYRQMGKSLDGSLVLRFREIGAFDLIVPTEMEDLDPAIARQLRFGCGDLSCVRALAETFEVEKIILGTLTRSGGQFVLDLRLVESRRGSDLRKVGIEGRKESQLLEQLSIAAGRITDDEAAAAALEAEAQAHAERLKPKPLQERLQEQLSGGVPRLVASLKRGWYPSLGFSANESEWDAGLGVEWQTPFSGLGLGYGIAFGLDRPCLCEGANFSSHSMHHEISMSFYPLAKTGLDGLSLGAHYRSSHLNWEQAGAAVPASRGRGQLGLSLGYRHELPQRITLQLRALGEAVTSLESVAAWGPERTRWRAGLTVGYRL